MTVSKFTEMSDAARPVYLIGKRGLEIARNDARMQGWVEQTGFTASAGTLQLLPGPDGTLAGALFGIGGGMADQPLMAGTLARRLPAGDWYLDEPGDDAFAAEDDVAARLAPFAGAIDVAVLGMGEDGHTASFFPGAAELPTALDRDTEALCLALRPPAAPHDRMTLSLAALLRSRHLYLHITGEGKRDVLERALAGEDAMELPIRSVFHREHSHLEIFYAPGS